MAPFLKGHGWVHNCALLFFMNDMKLHNKVLTHKYIDDITITESNKGHLEEAVNTIKEWSDDNNMRLNEKKTKEMLISFKRNPLQIQPLLLNNKAIEHKL